MYILFAIISIIKIDFISYLNGRNPNLCPYKSRGNSIYMRRIAGKYGVGIGVVAILCGGLVI